MTNHSSLVRLLKPLTALVVFLLLVLACLFIFSRSASKKPAALQGSYNVVLKADMNDANLTDLYLHGTKSEVETIFLTLSGIDRQRYHPAEFFGGNLYVIKQTGSVEGGSANPDVPDVTDALWKYDAAGKGVRLYSARGINFRISPDTGVIGMVAGAFPNETVILLDSNGNVSKTLGRLDLGVTDSSFALEPIFWRDGNFWLGMRQGLQLMGTISVNLTDFSVSKIDTSTLHISGNEFAFNPQSEELVFSDYVNPLDVEDVNNIPHQSASLYLYDISTGAKKTLLTASVTRGFYPAWLDATTLEYNDPNGPGRVSMKVTR